MNLAPLPSPLLRPLASNDELLDCLGGITGEPPEVVARRLLDEERRLGVNVRRDFDAFGLERHVWSERLIEFYRQTKAFCYETAVWNRTPLKLQIRDWIGRFLKRRGLASLKVLSFGDGLGFDSAYLAMLGHEVTYFEISDECAAFAGRVFELNGLTVHVVRSLEALPKASFDLVLSLDVLEHAPSPDDVVASFVSWLKPGGLLIAHSPFYLLTPYYSTHLRANRRYSGSYDLYKRHGLQACDGRFFWDPIVLEKTDRAASDHGPLAVRVGGTLLHMGRWFNPLHCFIARLLSRRDPRWGRDLGARLATSPATERRP